MKSPEKENVWKLAAFGDEAGSTLAEQIAGLRHAGIHRIDLRMVGDLNIAVLPLDIAREAAEKLALAGIETQMFGSPIGKTDIADPFESDLERLRHLAALAEIFGCRRVRIFSYYNAGGRSSEEWQNESLHRLRALRDEAAKLDLVLYHENERHIYGEGLDAVRQIAALRDDNFRLIFDFDNYVQAGDNVWNNWQTLRKTTDAFHLKDSRGGEHMPLGQGDGQAEAILRDALAHGWSGLLSLEPHLGHSGAVAATAPGGKANAQYGSLPTNESFQIAAQAALDLLARIGALLNGAPLEKSTP